MNNGIKFQVEMIFLGVQNKQSKAGKEYMMAKFMDEGTGNIFEFYVAGDRINLITQLAQAKPFQKACVHLTLSAFNNKPQVDLAGFEQ